jgi:hypothetical protein
MFWRNYYNREAVFNHVVLIGNWLAQFGVVGENSLYPYTTITTTTTENQI